MLTVPVPRVVNSASAWRISLRSSSICRAYCSIRSPGPVSVHPRLSRVISGVPISSSSFLIAMLTAACVRSTRSAARVKLRSSTTATKSSS